MIVLSQNEFLAILLVVGAIWGFCGYQIGNIKGKDKANATQNTN